MSETIRSFIAVELNDTVREDLEKIQKDFGRLDCDIKWVKPKNIHLTLKFLGSVHPKKMKEILALLPSLYEKTNAFECDITHVGAFPRAERPRVIWAGIEKNASLVEDLAACTENGLCRLGFAKEKRAFSPHVTLGRVRSQKNIHLLGKALNSYSLSSPIAQRIARVTLFKSTLTSQGPVYESLAQIPLRKWSPTAKAVVPSK